MLWNSLNIFSEYFWTAPELLRTPVIDRPVNGTKAADVFSFAIVLHEILCRCMPYSDAEKSPKGSNNDDHCHNQNHCTLCVDDNDNNNENSELW